MKTSASKHRAQRKQPGRKTASTLASTLNQRATAPKQTGPIRFPEVEGKTLEWVELGLNDDFNSIELSFADKTALRFDLQTALFVRPDLADWKTHNRREIKEWPRFRSPSLHE